MMNSLDALTLPALSAFLKAGTPEPAPPSLRERNLAALGRQWPELLDVLNGLGTPNSKLVGAIETHDLNLDLGHTTLYPGDAVRYADEQVTAYLARPGRFYLDPPERAPEHPFHQHYINEALYDYFGDRDIAHNPPEPVLDDGGFMVIYGLGLALHLPRLLAETPAHHFLLIEEHTEFLCHSLDLIDWAALLDGVEAREQTIHIVLGNDPADIGARVHWYFRGRGFGLIDGSFLYRHYSSPLLDGAFQDFVDKLPLLPISHGFFEDEFVMINHTTQNLWRAEFRLLELLPRLRKDVPAIIVGSGPSLDATIEDLRRLRPDTVIFSGGTSLMPLLRAGIRPDFHAELENTASSYDHLMVIKERYGLDGITLLASTTVHPALVQLFDDKVFFFRDTISSTVLWSPDGQGLLGTAPTCTNLALRASQIMGFRDIYLFGVDLGTRDAADHHAKGAFYYENKSWAEGQRDPSKRMEIESPANFGGVAYTSQILHWARMHMIQANQHFSTARLFNCSDGVRISGTTPKLASTIAVSDTGRGRAQCLADVRAEMKFCRKGELAPIAKMRAARAAFRDFYADVRREIADALQERLCFVPFYKRLSAYLEKDGPRSFQPLLRSVNIGTILMCCQVTYYFCRRVDESEEPDVMRAFLLALDARIAAMSAEMDWLFQVSLDWMELEVV